MSKQLAVFGTNDQRRLVVVIIFSSQQQAVAVKRAVAEQELTLPFPHRNDGKRIRARR